MVELIVVLALFSLAAVSFLLSSDILNDRKLKDACRMVQSDLRYAQRMAVLEGSSYTVRFMVRENAYAVSRRGQRVRTVYLAEGIVLDYTTDADNTVTYTAIGTTADACTIVLYSRSHTAHLTVNVGAGRVKQTLYYKNNHIKGRTEISFEGETTYAAYN